MKPKTPLILTQPKAPNGKPVESVAAPVAEAEKPEAPLAEHYGEHDDMPYVPYGVKTFKDLLAAQEAQEDAREIRTLAYQFKRLVDFIVEDALLKQKVPAFRVVANEFIALAAEALGETADIPAPDTTEELAAESLAETEAGAILSLIEIDAKPSTPLIMDVAIIKPGFGNKKDNHYYPREMLEKYAKAFEGAKQYETDHKPEEKSTRTWVSTIEQVTGFTEDGHPIGRVVVHNPDFAERLRQLNARGPEMLSKMECSILANGKVRKGIIDGQNANIVESITDVQSVDWVTKAGAGGHALNLVESDQGASPMPDEITANAQTPVTPTPAPVAEATPPATENQPLRETQAPAQKPPEPEPTFLAEADVIAAFAERKLPAAVRLRLMSGKYLSADALNEAIESEIAYLKEATQSGKPLLFENAAPPAPPSPQERDRAVHQVLARYR